jgi:hypothetical protein
MTATGTTTNTAAGAAAQGSHRWGSIGSARLGNGCSVGGRTASTKGSPRKEIVGYVLGKVEEWFPPSRVNDDDNEEETLLRYLNPNNGRVRFPSPRV